MSSSDALIWLAMVTVAVTVVAQLWHSCAPRGAAAGPQAPLPAGRLRKPPATVAAGQGTGRRHQPRGGAAVRRHAEEAATLAAAGAGTLTNPYAPGTQEYVLWIATYHLRLTELAEEQEEQGTVRVTKAPDYPSLSRP
ncbi:hypothetical protein [Ramlibacter montanisoli]|uniref:Uncharacterized protein n=1 Tax=Ramlibacter montanisoli TaxID=2732512 RepID=A0A849KQJ8_9BURK|nr:hypothetical protein [Ramlibacter montanisoli]NNU44099.1 hypothetical protein [Ramlibacter montanisoli]